MDRMIYCLIIYLVECFGWLTQILEVRESDIEEEQHLDEGDHAQERGEEETHPADGLAADTQSADSKYNPVPPVHNVQHVLGDVELYPGEALHPGDVHGEDNEDLTILCCDWSGQCDTGL